MVTIACVITERQETGTEKRLKSKRKIPQHLFLASEAIGTRHRMCRDSAAQRETPLYSMFLYFMEATSNPGMGN
jgi:hypothetical protein